MPKSKICHCGKDGHALNSINCPVHGNKPQKYQCWKCEGKKYEDIIDNLKNIPCSNCNGKGYIPLIPYQS